MKHFKIPGGLIRTLQIGTALITITACTTMTPNPQIADAQGRLTAAYNDKETAERGQGDLANAKLSLQSAQTEWRSGDREKSDHHLMMGTTYLDLAETRGDQAKLESQNAALSGQAQLNSKNAQLANMDLRLRGKDEQIDQRDTIIDGKNSELASKDQQLAQAWEQLRGNEMTVNSLGSTMVLQDVSFETGKSQLLPGGVNRLQPLINYLRLSPETMVRIEGYTDNVGGIAYNQRLSLDRAQSVMAILSSGGVGASRMTAFGSGMSKPLATNSTSAGRQSNRRVEITLLKRP
jgi:outer membrane protein OmpA-like peptidoglycan-associated protein